ncbi:unnamed protein product [Closterium sp. Naga37s-1]|nr:unnamed protein product [Closterium sp. Naga37s-1]
MVAINGADSPSPSPDATVLQVSVVQGRNLQLPGGVQDKGGATVSLSQGKNQVKTAAKTGAAPKWLQDFKIPLDYSPGASLPQPGDVVLQIAITSPDTGDEVLATCDVDVADQLQGGTVVRWYQIKDKDGAGVGEVCLVLRIAKPAALRPGGASPSHPKSSVASQLNRNHSAAVIDQTTQTTQTTETIQTTQTSKTIQTNHETSLAVSSEGGTAVVGRLERRSNIQSGRLSAQSSAEGTGESSGDSSGAVAAAGADSPGAASGDGSPSTSQQQQSSWSGAWRWGDRQNKGSSSDKAMGSSAGSLFQGRALNSSARRADEAASPKARSKGGER